MKRFAVVMLVAGLVSLPALAEVRNLHATISPLQETPPTDSTGSGKATLTYDTATRLLSWNITFSGLTGPATLAHFHGAGFPGVTAGIKVDIGAASGLVSPMIGSATITPTDAAELLQGSWYINLHTARWTGGEIRGQVLAGFGHRADADGDGRSDVYWRLAADGVNYLWQLAGLTVTQQSFLPAVQNTWSPLGLADFNGDGRTDIFWREQSTGLNYLWMLDGPSLVSQGFVPSALAPWTVVAVGDFENSGKGGALWRNLVTGENYVWNMDGFNITSQAFAPTVADLDWEVVGAGDFDGNGRTDIFWRNRVTGENYIWPMNSYVVASPASMPQVPLVWDVVGTPDANGDGRADIFWRDRVNGLNYLWLMNGTTILAQGFLPEVRDANWKIVAFGDYNGDGRGDVMWRNTSNGLDYVWFLNGLTGSPGGGYLPTVPDVNWQPLRR